MQDILEKVDQRNIVDYTANSILPQNTFIQDKESKECIISQRKESTKCFTDKLAQQHNVLYKLHKPPNMLASYILVTQHQQ